MKSITTLILFTVLGVHANMLNMTGFPISHIESIDHADWGILDNEEVREYLPSLIENGTLSVGLDGPVDAVLLNSGHLIGTWNMGATSARESMGTGGGH